MRLEIIIKERRYGNGRMFVKFTINGMDKEINCRMPDDTPEEYKSDKFLLDSIVKEYCENKIKY